MKARIVVSGCDDSTIVDVELTDAGLAAVQAVADALAAKSTSDCMPTMKISTLRTTPMGHSDWSLAAGSGEQS